MNELEHWYIAEKAEGGLGVYNRESHFVMDVEQLIESYATLQTRVAELEQDRKRLEYIKHELEHDNCTVWKSVAGWHYSPTGDPETCQTFDTFNEAVDTAMEAEHD